jgi:hypothetical protein
MKLCPERMLRIAEVYGELRNAAHLRSLDPAIGLRDAWMFTEQIRRLDVEALADESMPASNCSLGFREWSLELLQRCP